MKTAKVCFSKACINFGCCYGNQGWADAVENVGHNVPPPPPHREALARNQWTLCKIQRHLGLPWVPHLESSFASFATTGSRSTCTCTSLILKILAKFAEWGCESFGGFPCLFHCHSVWIRKLVAVRVVVLDTSGPTAMSYEDVVSAETGKEGAA